MATASRSPLTAASAARWDTLPTLDVAWLWKLVAAFVDVGRGDHPADPPPGHGVRLGHAVDDDALVGEVRHEHRHRRELVGSVREVLVDLVGDHPHAALDGPLPDRRHLLGRVHGAGRVVRADEQQHLGALGVRRLELLDGDLEAGLDSSVSMTTGTPPASVIASGYVVQYGAGQMTSSPGSHSAANAVYTACLPPLVTSTCDAGQSKPLSRFVLSGDRLPQLGQPAGGRVAVVLRIAAGGDGRLDDVVGRREVGLAGPEADDVLALGLQGLGLGVDGQRGRLGDRRQCVRRRVVQNHVTQDNPFGAAKIG